MKLARFDLTLIPLGAVKWSLAEDRVTWNATMPVFAVCLPFVEGTYTPSQLAAVLLENPLWPDGKLTEQRVLVKAPAGGSERATILQPTFNQAAINRCISLLSEYLVGDKVSDVAPPCTTTLPKSDGRWDSLTIDSLSDSPGFYQTVQERDRLAYATCASMLGKLGLRDLSSALEGLSVKFLQAVNSALMEGLIRTRFPDDRFRTPAFDALFPSLPRSQPEERASFHRAIERLTDRISGYQRDDRRLRILGSPNSAISEEELKDLYEQRDPNILLTSAVKDPLLSHEFGLTTQWRLILRGLPSKRADFDGSVDYWTLRIETSPSGQLSDLATKATAFRFGNEASPAPRSASLGSTGAFAWLSGREGGADYRAIQVDADSELVKTWLQQSSNTLATSHPERTPSSGIRAAPPPKIAASKLNADTVRADQVDHTHPAEGLANAQFGLDEPSSRGITFSASSLDLLARRDPAVDPDILFLEDLWTGYRIDVARQSEKLNFRSLHEEAATATLPDSQTSFAAVYESYLEREQLADDRPTSTEFGRWSGRGTAQPFPLTFKKDGGQKLNDQDQAVDLTPKRGAVVRSVKAVRSSLPRLWHPNKYTYRIRNVFLGTVSISRVDADIIAAAASVDWRERHLQNFGFFRAMAFTPGELVFGSSPTATETSHSKSNEQTVYLLGATDAKKVYLTPKAVDVQQAMYLGMIGSPTDRAAELGDYAFLDNQRTDLAETLKRGEEPRYFLDPDVAEVVVRAYSLTRNPVESPVDRLVDDRVCETLSPWNFGSELMKYGARSRWRHYRPICFEFVGTDQLTEAGVAPSTSVHGQRFQMRIPPGEAVELSIVPNVTRDQLANTVIYQNAIAAEDSLKKRTSLAADESLVRQPVVPIPPMIAERRIRVVHATSRPRIAPYIQLDSSHLVRNEGAFVKSAPAFRMARSPDSDEGYVFGEVLVDAPTTGSVHFRARWSDINDSVAGKAYTVEEGAFRAPARSVSFEYRALPSQEEIAEIMKDRTHGLRRLMRRSDEVCVENTLRYRPPVVMDGAKNPTPPENRQYGTIKFGDGRRKLLRLTAVAKCRYASLFPHGEVEVDSNEVLVDVPNRTIPPAAQISKVIPTYEQRKRVDVSGRTHIQRQVGFRVYLQRPFFKLIGPGARCAIGVLDPADYMKEDIRHLGSMWGEDPIERPHLDISKRQLTAADLVSPEQFADELDKVLYPDTHLVDRREARYERIPIKVTKASTNTINDVSISVASFALRSDVERNAYYFDFLVKEGFIGWIRLAFYAHQPHSLTGCALSQAPTQVYAALMQDIPVVHFIEQDWWTILVGPVFDHAVAFTAHAAEEMGTGTLRITSTAHHFIKVSDNGQQYFSLRLPAKRRPLVLIRKYRDDAVVGTILLR